jgi:Pyruvate/2-oxoacid:ferredoxin oxidoreductase delta subunit
VKEVNFLAMMEDAAEANPSDAGHALLQLVQDSVLRRTMKDKSCAKCKGRAVAQPPEEPEDAHEGRIEYSRCIGCGGYIYSVPVDRTAYVIGTTFKRKRAEWSQAQEQKPHYLKAATSQEQKPAPKRFEEMSVLEKYEAAERVDLYEKAIADAARVVEEVESGARNGYW